MATEIATLGIKVLSDDIVKATKRLDALENQSVKTEKATSSFLKNWKRDTAIGAAATIYLTKQVLDQINAYQGLTNKLKLVTKSAGELKSVQDALFNLSQQSRGDLEATTDLYFRFAKTTTKLGLSQKDLLDVTETVNQAVALSGTSAAGASAALFQMGQGLAANALRGQELNSVMEQTPRLAQAIADGMGIEIGALRGVAEQGLITSKVVIKALKSQSDVLKKEFGNTEKTIDQAMTQIKNSVLKTFGELDGKEFVGALDELRETLTDPAVVEGMQTIASGMVTLATWAVKAAAAFASFGDKIGYMAARLTGQLNDPINKLKDLKGEIAAMEQVQKNVPVGSRLWNDYTDNLTKAYKKAKILGDQIERISGTGKKKDSGDSGSATSSLMGDDGNGEIDKETQKKIDAAAKVLENLQESMLSEEQVIKASYDERLTALKLLYENELLAKEDQTALELEAKMLYDEEILILEEEKAEKLKEISDKKLQNETDYYERLYNMEKGSLTASLEFAKAMRKGDMKSAVDNGSLMLANLAKTNKEAFEISKAFALSKAIATLPSAVIDSYNNGGGYPWGLIPAGLMLATGLQQISAISSTSFGSKTSSASAGSGGSTSPSAPVASGLPDGSTALPDASEQPSGQSVSITLNGAGYSKENVRELIESINEEIGDGAELIAV